MNSLRQHWLLFAVLFVELSAAAFRAEKYGGHLSALVGFGCVKGVVCFASENRKILPDPAVVFDTGGYDGQFYYYTAASLYSGEMARMDWRELRLARIGYPLATGWAYRMGPGVLVVALFLVPLLAHLIAVHLFYLSMRATGGTGEAKKEDITIEGGRQSKWALYGVLLFAFNPLTLFSFLLAVSDGFALALAVSAVSIEMLRVTRKNRKEKKGEGRREGSAGTRNGVAVDLALRIASWFLLAFAILSKETFLAVAGGMAFGAAFDHLRRRSHVASIREFIHWSSTALPLLFWWIHLGFSPRDAARRGGMPFEGFLGYLSHADAPFSGRSLLALLLVFYCITLGALAWRSVRTAMGKEARGGGGEDRVGSRISGSPGLPGLLLPAMAGSLFLTLFLLSFATEEEYWANFANIARLFLPGILPLAVAVATRSAGAMWSRLSSIFIIIFTIAFMVGELREKPLPYHMEGAKTSPLPWSDSPSELEKV